MGKGSRPRTANIRAKKAAARKSADKVIKALSEQFPGFDQEAVEMERTTRGTVTAEALLGNRRLHPLEHRITIMPDTKVEYPELFLEVHLVGPPRDKEGFPEMFARGRCRQAESIDTADLVVFTGGPDVDPALYGEAPHSHTHFDVHRDETDITAYMHCLDNGIPMLGVCRGAQLGHVMNNGKLYQHVDNHYGDHGGWDLDSKMAIERISSVHHQMCMPNAIGGMKLLMTAAKFGVGGGLASVKWRNPKDSDLVGIEVEAFFYRESCFLGVQFHPEYKGYDFSAAWVLKKISEYMVNSPDIVCIGNKYQVHPDILALRKADASADEETIKIIGKENV
jgi:gamma-glutamyl-gamma-aminobutyrate hydrolase PuuD